MAEREAAIKLTMDDGQASTAMARLGDQVDKAGKKGQRGMALFGRGIDGAKRSMVGLAGKVRNVTSMVAGMGAAFIAANSAKSAIDLQEQYETLAFKVQTATGQLTKAADIQDIVGQSAALTARRSEEMTKAFGEVFGATKNLEFAKAVMADIGTTATATGASVATVATVAQQMQRKFGITADQVGESMAQIFEGAQQGGPSFEQLAGVIDVMGANLIQAGIKGKRGMDFLLGSLNATDAEFGDLGKQVAGIQNLFVKLGSSNILEKLAKGAGLKGEDLIDDKDAISRLMKILKTGEKGLAGLKATFVGPEEQKALRVLFTDPFEKALERAKQGGLKGKEATEQAVRILEEQIGKFGKTTLTAADLQKRAAERATEPAARLRMAQEKLTEAFGQPEIIDAIDALAESLPMLASLFANFVKFIAKNPVLSGALGVGGIAAKGFVTGMMQSIITGHMTGGANAAASIKTAHIAGGLTMKGSLLRNAGAFGAIAGAAMLAISLGREAIDSAVDEKGATTSGLAVARAQAASRTGGVQKNQKEADKLAKAIKAKQSNQGGFMNALFQTGDDEEAESRNIRDAQEDLRFKLAHIAKLKARKTRQDQDVVLGGDTITGAAPSGKPATVKMTDDTPRLIARAIRNELGGMTLRTEISNVGALGFVGRASAGPGGSRGPANMPTSSPGGGV